MLVPMGEWHSDVSTYSICEIVRGRILNLKRRRGRPLQAIDFDQMPYTIRLLNDTSRYYLEGEDVSVDTDDADICLGGAWGKHGKVELRYKSNLRRVEIKSWAAVGYEREAQKAWDSLVKELNDRKCITKVWESKQLESSLINDEFAPNEYQFNGTPAFFVSIFREFNDSHREAPTTYLDDRDINRIKAWINGGVTYQSVFVEPTSVPPSCLITVAIRPGGVVSKLTLQLETPPMYVVSPFVDVFINYLKKEGWIGESQPAQPEIKAAQHTLKVKHKTNPGIKANADAIGRLQDGQHKEANFYQWCKDYESEKGSLTEKQTPAEELYRKNVWNRWKKLTGKI